MTNRELLIATLTDTLDIDDGGATEEAIIHYHIACPYFDGDPRCKCLNKDISRDLCVECKSEWLDSDIDE